MMHIISKRMLLNINVNVKSVFGVVLVLIFSLLILACSGILSSALFKDSEIGNREYEKIVSWLDDHRIKSVAVEMIQNDGVVTYEEYAELSTLASRDYEYKINNYKNILINRMR